MGVRDEVGFLTIHQRYADHFFPGTSVLHTRVRYALFVPWLFEDLRGLTGAAATNELGKREIELAGRLIGDGVIGKRVYPKLSSQPPSTVYWNALSVWGILRPRIDGRTISRAQVFRLLRPTGVTTDDDGQSLNDFVPPFVHLPPPPPNWRAGEITPKLRTAEAAFLRDRLTVLRSPRDGTLSLLARLVRTGADAPSRMWSNEVRAIAGRDKPAIERARRAASLVGVGRAVYDALLETMLEAKDKQQVPARHRNYLAEVCEEHGASAVELDIDALEADVGALAPALRRVLTDTKDWIASGTADPAPLLGAYEAAEARKGPRARLAPTPNARARRQEWASDEHGLAEPLHYRWDQVRSLLDDLAVAR
jgi:hypothetical protein